MDDMLILDRSGLDDLIGVLIGRNYEVIGPTLRHAAIVYDRIEGTDDLPVGWTDRQAPGEYRLERRPDDALFGYVAGPQSLKRFLHPPEVKLWEGERDGNGFRTVPREPVAPYAFFGIKPCDAAAIAVQDQVFLRDAPSADGVYGARRDRLFLVVANCVEPGENCFCDSMGTGPSASGGFDIAITEVIGKGQHYFLIEVGTEAGSEVIGEVTAVETADQGRVGRARALQHAAAGRMGRTLDTTGIRELLYANLENPQWETVATRCLTCTNCTMVCPTCFCFTVEDGQALDGSSATRVRRWDSCFTVGFSYIHGGPQRSTSSARYRQWLTHKLASWIDQFGTSGCVGCGRCITWCPVGIDITEEVAAIRATDRRRAGTPLSRPGVSA